MKTALIVLVLALSAFAQKWEHLTEAGGQEILTDLSTISGDSVGKQMWFKYVPLDRPGFIAKMKLPKSYDHQLVLLQFKCTDRTVIFKEAVWYSTDSKKLKSMGPSSPVRVGSSNWYVEVYDLLCPKASSSPAPTSP